MCTKSALTLSWQTLHLRNIRQRRNENSRSRRPETGGRRRGPAGRPAARRRGARRGANFTRLVLGCIEAKILQVNMRLNSYLVRKEIEKKGHGERLKNENLNKRP